MATTDDLKLAIGCLSTVFPQFVAKELADLTDQLATAIQGFTDPLAAIGDIHVDSLVDNVAAISEGDVFGNLASAAVGLTAQYTKREISDYLTSMVGQGTTSKIASIVDVGSKVVNSIGMAMSLFPDMPYAAGQVMCKAIVEAADLKNANLLCLRKHIVQLVNGILVLVKTGPGYVDRTFHDLGEALVFLRDAQRDLALSERSRSGGLAFDKNAFERARQDLQNAGALLTPQKDGTTVLDLVDIAGYGSVTAGELGRRNERLATLVLPSLMNIIEAEMGAVMQQVRVINFYVVQLGNLIANFRRAGLSSQIQQQRANGVAAIRVRVDDLVSRISLAVDRQSLRAASGEMLLWASRIKSILVTMDSIKNLTLQEGSVEGPDKAFVLKHAFDDLLLRLTAINDDATAAGIEDPSALKDRVFALTSGARRLLKDLEDGRADPSRLATFHAIALATATGQTNRIDRSSAVAAQQKTVCQRFADIDLQFGSRFHGMLDSLRQLGLDRGVDMLSTGAFGDFIDAGPALLSYVGTAISCLEHGINGTDDAQLKQQIGKMRDDLIGQQTNLQIAAVDSADQGRSRFIAKLQDQMSTIQQNAKVIDSIVSGMKDVLSQLGEAFDDSFAGLQKFNAFFGNLDHLAVGAGGRLASGLEEFSKQPNAGVVACD